MVKEFNIDVQYQKMEDIYMESHINSEASRLFIEWTFAPKIEFVDKEGERKSFKNFIPLVAPKNYTIYDELTARYIDTDITKQVMKEFKKKQEEYEQNI